MAAFFEAERIARCIAARENDLAATATTAASRHLHLTRAREALDRLTNSAEQFLIL